MNHSIIQAVKELYAIDTDIILSRPDPSFGDYATNIALQLAGKLQQPPRVIAEAIAEKLQQSTIFTEVSVAGPGFLNLRVSSLYLKQQLDAVWSDHYGGNQDGQGKTVVVEYPSPNMAKPYSIGHLRPGNQGWAVKRLMEETGWKVVTDNHLGDYGAPFGVWVVGFLRFSSDEKLRERGVYELGDVYIKTKQALKKEKERGEHELADEVQSWLLKLENGDETALSYSQRFKEISLGHIHEVMGRLQISTDMELGESFFVPKGKMIVKQLIESGVATQNLDGSVIVPLDDQGLDVPLLVQKSNGAALYATSDLATILYREETIHPDRVIYAVGAEQQFYFRQIFALAKKLTITTELIHIWFGTIDQIDADGTREKMSSRKGVILMETLLDRAEQTARDITKDRQVSDDDIKKIALGAIKFSDFVADRRTNILFDWASIFALSGYSGPYIQYAAVRVNKLLADNIPIVSGDAYDYLAEKPILAKLLDYPEVIRLAARDLEPHRIASYLYELARDMNRYYEATRVSDADEPARSARLELLGRVSYVFTNGLSILGIEVPSSM